MNRSSQAIALSILVLVILGYCWMARQSNKPHDASEIASSSSSPTTNDLPSPPASPTPLPVPAPAHPTVDIPLDHKAEDQREKEVWNSLLATPIVFYAKVVDTQGNAVIGATALISMVDKLTEEHTKLETTSDAEGLFSVSGHGLAVVVQVSKEGYYSTDKSSGTFAYAKESGQLSVYTDPNKPAIFVLIKRGQAEPLVVTKGYIKIANDGTARAMSLTTGETRIVPNGDFIVQAWVQDQGVPVNSNQPYNWHCKITVSGGGLQICQGGDFNFIAPDNGYQPTDEIDMPADSPQWSPTASRSYFVRLGNGDYAQVNFTIAAEKPYKFEIASYLNPIPGHQNLEYDPNQQINK